MPKSIVKVVTARKTHANYSPANEPARALPDDTVPTTFAGSVVLWQAQELLNRAQCEDDIQVVRALLRGVHQTF